MVRCRTGTSKTLAKFGCTGRVILFCTVTPILALLWYHYQKGLGVSRLDFHDLWNTLYDNYKTDIIALRIMNYRSRFLRSSELNQDLCLNQWTGENLIGRCWGLTTSTNVPDILSTAGELAALSADGCRKLCCDLGEKCISWQFWGASGICKVGKTVRLGLEGGNTHRWCEPLPPQKWVGGKRNLITSLLKNDSSSDSQKAANCEWGENESGQCFGLGPEHLNSTKGRLSAIECALGCCENPHCRLWQHLPDRGCYFNDNQLAETPHCDQYKGVYTGGRKKLKKRLR